MTAILAERLAQALADTAGDPLPGPHADDAAPMLSPQGIVPAAVLIAITDRPRPGVILTQRTTTLSRHAGQVAFPGGRIDADDPDAAAAALREAQEEIALPPSEVTLVGELSPYRTVTGYAVSPVIGVTAPDLPLVPAEAEVSDWFEVPLDILIDPARHRRASRMWQGVERHYIEIDWPDRYIWGATAAMIVSLSHRLRTFRP
jgi:8-oxo-dGTP pyrophosphatase MutT (NUDIX family)